MLFQLVIPSGAPVITSVKQFCCPLKTSLVLCFGASNLLVGFWRGVNQYKGEKFGQKVTATYLLYYTQLYTSYTSYTQSYRYTIKIYSCSLPELVPQSAGNTPNLTTIREPGVDQSPARPAQPTPQEVIRRDLLFSNNLHRQ